ncbi:f-box family protein, partial [Genlisea aurea]
SSSSPRKTQLHDLPQDLLIRIVCRVEHDDLKRLMLVSTAMKEAGLTAKELHFAFSTPKTRRRPLNFTKAEEDLRYSDDESEAPNAPGKSRLGRIRLLTSEKLASITVSLF